MSDPVKIIECPRDAWQGLPGQIPADLKVNYLKALISAGFKHIDAASFVSPKTVPQMSDSEAVLKDLDPPDDVEIIGIVVNEKGAERAIATGAVTTLGYPCSISETFLRRNQNQSLEQNLAVLEQIHARARESGLGMVVYISMAFGNPYGDPWNEEKISETARKMVGIASISLADTIGSAEPELVRRVVAGVGCEVGVHLHSTRGAAIPKILAAYGAGCRRFDSAIGGLGGCPFAQDELVGNIPTEEVLRALEQRGVNLPLQASLARVIAFNDAITDEFAR